MKPALQTAAYIVAFGLIWELVWLAFRPPDYLLPSLHSVLAYLFNQWEVLLRHAYVTAYETLLGFIAAVVVGLVGAFVLNAFPRMAPILWPSVLFAQLTPKVAIAPLLLLWLGFGIESKVLIAFLIAFFPMLINAYAGYGSIDQEVSVSACFAANF
jgi:NitT/TauT family transport system permease protein